MTTLYVVKTGEKFLCTAEDGDIGLAPEIKEAMSFLSYEEAETVAKEHADPGYEILAVNVTKR
ncbi:hypothetical protein [Paraburkholderia fynbosensis]|uniref:Uncharacterized protein n=1 Tax=Paraburkholderia fynbosensis TaxID=1200993 RepID=A0A6J5H594_9BURK|nr:hypothetical protein [Paraburkholderia fynbosensis]CAB3809182.1 hypothetical protein LMG27177_06746 [Paraburkholderia fynbosensis]